MYICVCNGVTERQIGVAAKRGATTIRDLRECLGVASECGRCARSARECLRDAMDTHRVEQKIARNENSVSPFGEWLKLEPEAS